MVQAPHYMRKQQEEKQTNKKTYEINQKVVLHPAPHACEHSCFPPSLPEAENLIRATSCQNQYSNGFLDSTLIAQNNSL